jgi:hypothetical protein
MSRVSSNNNTKKHTVIYSMKRITRTIIRQEETCDISINRNTEQLHYWFIDGNCIHIYSFISEIKIYVRLAVYWANWSNVQYALWSHIFYVKPHKITFASLWEIDRLRKTKSYIIYNLACYDWFEKISVKPRKVQHFWGKT